MIREADSKLPREAWPALPLSAWEKTRDTLHMWTQIVGKLRLARAPHVNHWWQVPLYVTARGLTTSTFADGHRALEIRFDFIARRLLVEASDGRSASVALEPKSVSRFYSELRGALAGLDIDIAIHPRPNEVDPAIPFAEDETHASYDPDAALRFWRVLLDCDRVLARFRGDFIGKASPTHFFWGSFDLAATRFSGRRAPPHPGGVPNLPDRIAREAYSHECSSCGWWPGGGPIADAAFYAYAYPEPDGYREAVIEPAGSYYHSDLREWILPYDQLRESADPDAALLSFARSTYEAAASLGGWDRPSLER